MTHTEERKAKRFAMLREASARQRGDSHISGGGIIRILASLIEGPATPRDLQAAADLSRSVTQQWIAHLRHAAVVRVCGWEKDKAGRFTVPVLELNVEGLKDKPRPRNEKMTGAQRSARYRMRKKGGLPWVGLL